MTLDTQIVAELSGSDPITFFDLMERLDFTGMPEQRSYLGKKVGHHGPVMDALSRLVARNVIAELSSGIDIPRYRISATMCDRLAS